MLVHNSIESDARVRKQAKSLGDKGYAINLIGYGDEKQGTLDGIPITIVSKSFLAELRAKALRLKKVILISLTIFLLLAFVFFFNSIPYLSLLFILMIIVIFYVYKNFFIQIIMSFYQKIGYADISRSLLRELTKQKPNIVHAHDIIALMAAVEYKKSSKSTILVWDAHELYTELAYKSKDQASYIDKIIRKSAELIDCFIVINDSFVDFYSKKYPNLPHPVVIMNATRENNNLDYKEDKLRSETMINSNQNILLFQGGLSNGRGVQILLEASELIPKNWSLVFMGNGVLKSEIIKKSNSLNKNRPSNCPAITIIPPAPYEELASWTSGATLGAIPYENTSLNHLYCTPNKLWEYPNAGVPIIASGMIEMKKMIHQYDTGILLPQDFDADDIVEAISSLSKERLTELRENCRKFNSIQNWARYEAELLSMYKEIAK